VLIPRGDGLGPESLATEWLMDLSHKYFVFKLLRLQKEPFKADTNFPRPKPTPISRGVAFLGSWSKASLLLKSNKSRLPGKKIFRE